MAYRDPCFACGLKLGKNPNRAITEDGAQVVYVGSECFKKIKAAGDYGYLPPHGGPRLYVGKFTQDGPDRIKIEFGNARVIYCDRIFAGEAIKSEPEREGGQ